MNKFFSSICCWFAMFSFASAQSPSWGKQVSCIVYSHCTSCHNPNGLAPFSLQTYSEAYNYRSAILNAVVTNKMPPYLPDVNYSHLAGARVLTETEKTMISDWVTAGAPAGDTSQMLPPPVYSSGPVIINPDLTARIPDFTIPNTGGDLYQAFVITNANPVAKYITQIEVVPGNRSVVHHVLVYQDSTYTPVVNDSAFAGPGYVAFGGIGSNAAKLVSTWVPGSGIYNLPTGMGIRLGAGARIVLQIHYPDGSAGQMDSTRINVKFSAITTLRNVNIAPILNMNNLTNGPLFIPADSVRTFYSKFTIPANITAIMVGPHAHLLCKKFEVYGVTPINDTIRFIKINDWNFHWQGGHGFQKPVKIPIGTVLHSMAYYDNTVNNPDNPNSPPQNVSQGEATTDEMMLIYFAYLPYQAGDENIIIDTASHMAHYQNCVPEPIPLPVTFINFTAQPVRHNTLVQWATAQEKNCSHYDIERSADGFVFSKIATQPAAINGDRRNDYSYTDNSAKDSKYYYRIKQVDKDGKFVYTPYRLVIFANEEKISAYPNPVRRGESMAITIPNAAQKIELINAMGQVVYMQTSFESGTVKMPIYNAMATGEYVLRIYYNQTVETQKVVVY